MGPEVLSKLDGRTVYLRTPKGRAALLRDVDALPKAWQSLLAVVNGFTELDSLLALMDVEASEVPGAVAGLLAMGHVQIVEQVEILRPRVVTRRAPPGTAEPAVAGALPAT